MSDKLELARKALKITWVPSSDGYVLSTSGAFRMCNYRRKTHFTHKETSVCYLYSHSTAEGKALKELIDSVLINHLMAEMDKEE